MSRTVDPVPMAGSRDPRLALALTLAHEAGRLAMAGQKGTVSFKGRHG